MKEIKHMGAQGDVLFRRIYREDIARVCDAVLSTAGDGGRVADRLLALAKAALED